MRKYKKRGKSRNKERYCLELVIYSTKAFHSEVGEGSGNEVPEVEESLSRCFSELAQVIKILLQHAYPYSKRKSVSSCNMVPTFLQKHTQSKDFVGFLFSNKQHFSCVNKNLFVLLLLPGSRKVNY